VSVRGTSCAPGPVLSPTQDYVKVASTMVPRTVVVAVRRNGSWSGRFTVPADSDIVPGLVAATCFTDGRASPTTYTTHRFTVTGGATAAAGNAGRVAAVASGADPNPTARVPSTIGSDDLSIWWLLLMGVVAAGIGLLLWKRRGPARRETLVTSEPLDGDVPFGPHILAVRPRPLGQITELTAIAERLQVIRDQRAERAATRPAPVIRSRAARS
jgi:hypothetical protein